MKSTLKIYSIRDLKPDKLFVIENMETFLTLQTLNQTINNFQYIKHEMEIDIKIDKTYSGYAVDGDTSNYIAITNTDGITDETTYYYFITKRQWRGQETICYHLLLDTLNTFSTKLDWDDKTKILREHKDRYEKTIGYDLETESPAILYTAVNANNFIQFNQRFFDDMNGISEVTFSGTKLPSLYYFYLNEDDEVFKGDLLVSNIQWIKSNSYTGKIYFYDGAKEYLFSANDILENRILGMTPPTAQTINLGTDLGYTANILVRQGNYDYIINKIDFYSEGLNPQLYGNKIAELDHQDNLSWYLMYYGGNTFNGYLIPSRNIYSQNAPTNEITPSDLIAGRYYYILPTSTGNQHTFSALLDNSQYTFRFNHQESRIGGYRLVGPATGICFTKDGTEIKVYEISWKLNIKGDEIKRDNGDISEIANVSKITLVNNFNITGKDLDTLITSWDNIQAGTSHAYTYSATTSLMTAINDIPRNQSEIYKIIELPYCPFKYTHSYNSNKEYVIFDTAQCNPSVVTNADTTWTGTLFQVKFRDRLFENELVMKSELFSVLTPDGAFGGGYDWDRPFIKRNDTFETKIYHSEFYAPTLVYDSFTYTYQLEKVNPYLQWNDYATASEVRLKYVVTSTCNSRFAFIPSNYAIENVIQNYEVMTITRNNELPIYNSSYIDYVRSGYNYDIKTKDRQTTANWVNVGLSTIGSVAGLVTGNVTGIAMGVSTASKVISAVNQEAQAEQNIEQKLTQGRLQSASVSGSDDVDIMNAYSDNKLKLMLYTPSERMKKALYDLFYYTGYIANRIGLPEVNTRKFFNFIQCEPVFRNYYFFPEEVIEDIITKFQTGVTYIHKVSYGGTYYYDLKQEYENWENIFRLV